MDSETINAIASLWPLALILFLLIFILLFKSQIRAVLTRLAKIQIRRGDTEIVIVQTENTEVADGNEAISSKAIEETTDTSKTSSVSENQERGIESLSSESLVREMQFAFFMNEIERAEELYNKLQSNQQDQIERFKNESFYLYLRFTKGKTNALEELKKLSVKTKSYPIAHSSVFFNIGKCYQEVSQYEQAINAFEQAQKFAQEEPKQAICITSISNCHYSLGHKKLAIDVVEDAIGGSTSSEALATLYLHLGELFKKLDEKKLRGIALEKALEIQPNNPQTLFDVAFSYSEGEFSQLSLFHYQHLLKFSSNHRAANNNLGVAYRELEMPINSIMAYKRAWKQKDTIAAANLAYQYLAGGFLDEAKEILAEAKLEADVHSNVGSALVTIAQNEESESSKEKKALEEAVEQQRFLLDFGEAYFKKTLTPINLEGIWYFETKVAEVKLIAKVFFVTWGEGESKRKFSGILNNLGAKVDFKKWGYNLPKMEKDFVADGTGYAFLSPELNIIYVMKHDKKDFQILTIYKESNVKG